MSNHKPDPSIYLRLLFREFARRILFTGLFKLAKIFPDHLKVLKYGFVWKNVFYLTHNAGLFSIASTVLDSVSQISQPVKRISGRFGGSLYKNYPFQDFWMFLFLPPNKINTPPQIKNVQSDIPSFVDWWGLRYEKLPLSSTRPYIKNYFIPTEEVDQYLLAFSRKYLKAETKTIGVHFRGTDKQSEIQPVDLEVYFDQIRLIFSLHKGAEIILLTDEVHVQKKFMKKFDGKVHMVTELPASESKVGLHFQKSNNRLEDCKKYLAAVLMISRTDFLITHTGNGALWEALYRENLENFQQN